MEDNRNVSQSTVVLVPGASSSYGNGSPKLTMLDIILPLQCGHLGWPSRTGIVLYPLPHLSLSQPASSKVIFLLHSKHFMK